MKRPTITQAKQICQASGARGCIILVFYADDFHGVSYGETSGECAQLGRTLDAICEEIGAGRIEVWES